MVYLIDRALVKGQGISSTILGQSAIRDLLSLCFEGDIRTMKMLRWALKGLDSSSVRSEAGLVTQDFLRGSFFWRRVHGCAFHACSVCWKISCTIVQSRYKTTEGVVVLSAKDRGLLVLPCKHTDYKHYLSRLLAYAGVVTMLGMSLIFSPPTYNRASLYIINNVSI